MRHVVHGLCQWLIFGYELRATSFGFDFGYIFVFGCVSILVLVLVSVLVSVAFGIVVLLIVARVRSLYFSFGYVFCPRHAGIMLLEGGLTGNSYGLQRMSHLRW